LISIRVLAVVIAAAATSGCFVGDEFADEWSTPEQIKAAAARCGIDNFEPTRAGGAWAAYVDDSVPDHEAKEDCIYADLEGQGRRTTR
jgi:hypothetical protein